jgi:hypothetical protein
MKPHTLATLLATQLVTAAAAAAQAAPASTTDSTSVSTEIKDGHGTITITVEKDGKKETRVLKIDSSTPYTTLTDQIVEKIEASSGDAAPNPPKKKVTYLGVMLAEPGSGFMGGGGLSGGGLAAGGGADAAPIAPGLPPGTGLSVTGVSPDSPAASAGLQSGDVLAKLNDQILINPSQFTTLVRTMKEGENVRISYVRAGESKEVTVTLASREEDPVPTGLFGLGGGAMVPQFNRVLTLDPNGNVIESAPGALALPPAPPVPPTPPLPSGTVPTPTTPDVNQNPNAIRPAWERALREAASAKEKAASQWQEQLSKWRADWSENQKKATDEYRRAIEKMGEELAKAREAAEKAREEARRAVEEAMRSLEQEKEKNRPAPKQDAPPTPAEPEEAKTT